MANAFQVGEASLTKAEFLADVVNRTLHDLVIRCTKSEEIRDYYYVSIIGYGVGRGGVASAFTGSLGGRDLVRISEIGENPDRLEERLKTVADGRGGLVQQKVRFPVWVYPKALNDTPMCAGLMQARRVLDAWLHEHPSCFPPVILHITDGGSTDGDPTTHGRAIADLTSKDGPVLLFNCHLSSTHSVKVEYPDDPGTLPNHLARMLFSISSVLPSTFVAAARSMGIHASAGARGFVFNADAASLVHFFEIGTRAVTPELR